MKTTEIRVRPVVRHIVTRYSEQRTSGQDDPPEYARKLETLGEFDNEAQAEQVAEALRGAIPVPTQYAIVQRSFDPDVKVYYADSAGKAEQLKAELESTAPFREYRIYAREAS